MSESQDHTFIVQAFMAAFKTQEAYDQTMLSESEYEHADKSDWIIATHIIPEPKIRETIKLLIETLKDDISEKNLEFLKSETADLPTLLQKLSLSPTHTSPIGWVNYLNGPVYREVIKQLSSFGIKPSQQHDTAIRATIHTMMDSTQLSLPTVLPVPPGFGKTTILKELIIDRLNYSSTWCALIVLERIDDIYKQIDEIRQKINNPFDVEIWPTFSSQLTCPDGLHYFQAESCVSCTQICSVKADLKPDANGNIPEPESFKKVKSCPAKHFKYRKGICDQCPKKGSSFNDCLVQPKQPKIFNNKRVLYVSQEFYYRMITVVMDRDGLTHFMDIPRRVFIDERPQLTKPYQEHYNRLLNNRNVVGNDLKEHLPDYNDAVLAYAQLFKEWKTQYVNSSPYKLKTNLIEAWEREAKKNLKMNPEALIPLKTVLDNGGYYEPKPYNAGPHAITGTNYLNPKHSENRTVILDGTGQFDDLYDRSKYYVRSISNNLKYPNLHFHFCNVELSKDYYKKKLKSDKQFIRKLCTNIISLVGNKNTLVLCYKDYRSEFNKQLVPTNIALEHFGNILGKNDYSNAVNVVFTGVLTFDEADYGAMDLAVNGMCDPLDIPARIKVVKLNQKLVGIYQQVYRSKLRHHIPTNEIHVYLPTSSDDLQKLILARFPGSSDEGWLPKPVYPFGYLLRTIAINSKIPNKQVKIRQYVAQTKSSPEIQEIQVAWPAVSYSSAANLRSYGIKLIKQVPSKTK